MNAYIDAYAHKNPDMKVLEIGAGTGCATFLVFDTLIHHGEQEAGGPKFGHYEFTDISAAFFEGAKDLFKARADRMSFRVPDQARLRVGEIPSSLSHHPDSRH